VLLKGDTSKRNSPEGEKEESARMSHNLIEGGTAQESMRGGGEDLLPIKKDSRGKKMEIFGKRSA